MAYSPFAFSYGTPYTAAAPFETEEQKKQKKEAEQKAILERIQTNRLYLKKVKKECALESFENLQKLQLFLFEVMIEALEVTVDSELNLVSGDKDKSYVTARIRFLNSPYMEICEKDIVAGGPNQSDIQTDQFKAISQGGLTNAYHTGGPPATPSANTTSTIPAIPAVPAFPAFPAFPGSPGPDPVFGPPTEEQFLESVKVKWNKTSGKSCMFSLTPLQVVQDLEKYPVVVQVVKRQIKPEIKESDQTEKDKDGNKTEKEKEADKTEKDKEADKTEKDKEADKTGKDKMRVSIKSPGKTSMSKKPVPEDETEKYEPIGYAYIKLPEEFSLSVLQASKEGVLLPVSNVHRANLNLENVFGTKKGTISVYIRLSTFGTAIITNFHTVGAETRYLFKPSSTADNFQPAKIIPEGSQVGDLKPLFAEEEKAVGISVVKNEDTTFKKQILWKARNLGCGCTFVGECLYPTDPAALCTEITPMALPDSSQLSLCRDAIQPNDIKNMKKLQTVGNTCNWHNLVTREIQNSPGETCGCIPSAKKEIKKDVTKKRKTSSADIKRKPRGVCTCSPTSDLLMFLRGDDTGKKADFDFKKTHLGMCNCFPGMVNKSPCLENKPTTKEKTPLNKTEEENSKQTSGEKKKKSCCDCCKCVSSKKEPKKKTSKSEKILLGYCGWPSLRSFVKKDPLGWDDEESKKLQKLLDDTDKFLEGEQRSKPKDKKKNCGCIPADKSKSPSKKKKSKKQRGLLKPLSSSDDSSSDSDKTMTKMPPLGKNLPPIQGFGMKAIKSDCGCECPDLKKALLAKTLFPL